MAVSVGTLMAFLDGDASGLKKELKSVRAEAKRTADDLEEMGFSGAVMGAGAFAAALGLAAVKAVELSANLEETRAAMGVAFGSADAVASVEQWVKDTSAAIGRGEIQLRESVTSMQLLLGPMLGSAEKAQPVSQALTKLAADVGALLNVSDADALLAFRSALAGEAEPVKRFGVTMTDAALDAWLLEKGIRGTMGTLSEQSKATARAAFLMDRLGHAAGSAAAEADSLPNQLKALAGGVQDLATKFGDMLRPAATAVATALNDVVTWAKSLDNSTLAVIASVVAFAGALAGVVAVAGAWVTVAPAVSGALALLKVGFLAAGSAGLALLLPLLKVVAVAGAVVLAIGLLRKAWDADFLGMRTLVQDLGAWFAHLAKSIPQLLDSALGWVVDRMEDMRAAFWSFVTDAMRGVGKLAQGLQRLGIFTDLDVRGYLADVEGFRNEKADNPITRGDVSAAVEAAMGAAREGWEKGPVRLAAATTDAAEKAASWTVDKLQSVGDFLGSAIREGWDTVASGLSGVLGTSGQPGAAPGAPGPDVRAQAKAEQDALVAKLLGDTSGLSQKELEKAKARAEKEAKKQLEELAEAAEKAAKAQAKLDKEFVAWSMEGLASRPVPEVMDTMANAHARARPVAVRFGEAMEDAGQTILDGVVSGSQKLSGMLKGIADGFMTGGVVGAIIGAATALLMHSQGFANTMAIVDGVLQDVANVLGTLFNAVQPVLGAVSVLVDGALSLLTPLLATVGTLLEPLAPVLVMVGHLLSVLTPAFNMLGLGLQLMLLPIRALEPALRLAFEAVKLLARGLGWVFGEIAKVWNGMLEAISGFLRALSEQEIFGARPFAFLAAWADDVDASKVDLDAHREAMAALKDMTWESAAAQAEAAAAAHVLGKAASDAASSLTNVPTWWRVEGARYDATAAGRSPTLDLSAGGAHPALEGRAGGTVVEGDTHITIEVHGSSDADAVAEQVVERIERARQRRTGSRYSSETPRYLEP